MRRTTTRSRSVRTALAIAAAGSVLSGCGWTGLNSVALPYTAGGGSDALQVTVQVPNAANLVPNSEVKYGDVTVGSVRKIELKNWVATLTLGIDGDVKIPANVHAEIAQRSLLGAEYLDLSVPKQAATKVRPATYLRSGDVIGLNRSGRYPETEEVLTAASMLLNGGGLSQVHTITTELNSALGGHAADIKQFMHTVSAFTARLDRQRGHISTTLGQLNRLATDVSRNRAEINRVLQVHPKAFQLLDQERAKLVRTLRTVNNFSTVAHRVIGETKVGLQKNLNNMVPVTAALARNGNKLAESTDDLTYPFMTQAVAKDLGGDYLNLITTIEVSTGDLVRDWIGSTPLDGLFTGVVKGTPTGPAAQGVTGSGALSGLLNQITGLAGGGTTGAGGSGSTSTKGTSHKSPSGGTTSAPTSGSQSGVVGGLLSSLLGGH